MKIHDLDPNGLQKSFYGKAKVIELDDGTELLKSYDTIVAKRLPNGELRRCYDYYVVTKRGPFFSEWDEEVEWTATTGKHIKAFCGLGKKEFLKLPIEIGDDCYEYV